MLESDMEGVMEVDYGDVYVGKAPRMGELWGVRAAIDNNSRGFYDL